MTDIRQMDSDDLGRVLEINQANVPEVGTLDADRLRMLVDESTLALVVDQPAGADTPVVVGFCLVLGPGSTYDSVNYSWFMDRHDDALYLDRVAFDDSCQGQGLGTRLYAEVDRLASEHRIAGRPVSRLCLEVNVEPPNEQSLAFHARRGFVEVGRQATPYGIEVSLQEKRY